ncbi:MAG: F420-dependent methylene-tetrahydromethanopterin reductase, partial [Tepidiformaceae bacterium]
IEGRREEAAAAVPDEMVLKTNLIGTDDMVRERIRVHRGAGVSSLRVSPEGRTLGERLATLGRFVDLVRETEAEPVTV